MLQRHQVIPLFLERCPGFLPTWKKHKALWQGQEAGIFNDLGEFATYIVDSYEAHDIGPVVAAFEIAEQLLSDGDEEVRGVAEIGFLETVQIIASNRPFGPEVFTQWLGPKSKDAWAEIIEMWRGKRSLMEVIRAEKASQSTKRKP
jgi:hypothetical protein